MNADPHKRFKEAAAFYADEADGEALLFLVSCILEDLKDMCPEISGISDDFMSAVSRYMDWDVKTLDDAFGVSRPRGVNLEARRFRLENDLDISLSVEILQAEGEPQPAVFDLVGARFARSGKTIETIYRQTKEDWMKTVVAVNRSVMVRDLREWLLSPGIDRQSYKQFLLSKQKTNRNTPTD